MPKSENLQKLEKLINKLETTDFVFESDNDDYYLKLTRKIDYLIHDELKKIELEKNNNNKLRCYESLFTSVICLLEGVKHIV